VVTTGRISKKDLNKVYQGTLDKATVLCSDSHRSYGAFAKSSTIIHKKCNASKEQKTADKIDHVQNVNNMDIRLRKFMESFNVVSTKYFQNYLNWSLALEKIESKTNKMAALASIALASNQAWIQFKEIAINKVLFRT
jgi:hypothetical protein